MNLPSDISSRLELALSDLADQASKEEWAWRSGVWTRALKNRIGKIATELNFDFCSNECDGGKYGEWLYDMCWFTEVGGFLRKIFLAAEFEWNPEPAGDGDFEKLIQARCDLRFWVFGADSPSAVKQMFTTCQKQIDAFNASTIGDRYLLAGIDLETKKYQFIEIPSTL